MKKLLAAGLAIALTVPGAPLGAQAADQAAGASTDSEAGTQTDAAPARPVGPIGPSASYGPAAPPPKKCRSDDPRRPGEIVVCGAKDDAEFRVKSSAELDPNSKAALNDGRPQAPDFAESCKKNPEKGPCIKFGGVPPPAYMIKFEDLPDTPEGSDADKIAKGEKKGGD